MKKTGYKRSKWCSKDDQTLIRDYRDNIPCKDIALELNKTIASVYQRAFILKLKKEVNQSRFKPGHTTNNLPENTITLRGRGGKWIKRNGVWISLHKYVWETTNGAIPNGFVLTFVDGDRENCELSNLQLITKQNIMRKNNCFSLYPNDIIQCSRIIKKINSLL